MQLPIEQLRVGIRRFGPFGQNWVDFFFGRTPTLHLPDLIEILIQLNIIDPRTNNIGLLL